MSAPVWPDHLLSIDEWEQLPTYDRFKVEVVEGVLIGSPRRLLFHQRAIHKLVHALNVAIPQELSAVAEVEVVIDRGCDCPRARHRRDDDCLRGLQSGAGAGWRRQPCH